MEVAGSVARVQAVEIERRVAEAVQTILSVPDRRHSIGWQSGQRRESRLGALADFPPPLNLLLHLAAFDCNCPQHITPRFTEAELAQAFAPLRARLEALESENKALRSRLAAKGD